MWWCVCGAGDTIQSSKDLCLQKDQITPLSLSLVCAAGLCVLWCISCSYSKNWVERLTSLHTSSQVVSPNPLNYSAKFFYKHDGWLALMCPVCRCKKEIIKEKVVASPQKQKNLLTFAVCASNGPCFPSIWFVVNHPFWPLTSLLFIYFLFALRRDWKWRETLHVGHYLSNEPLVFFSL